MRGKLKITKNVHCLLLDQTILSDDISSYFIFKPWLITMAMLPKPTMISLLKHSCQDNIFLLKHDIHSFQPTLILSSQKFNQLHFYIKWANCYKIWCVCGGGGVQKCYEKINHYFKWYLKKMHFCQEEQLYLVTCHII